jgi:hypothetical protein
VVKTSRKTKKRAKKRASRRTTAVALIPRTSARKPPAVRKAIVAKRIPPADEASAPPEKPQPFWDPTGASASFTGAAKARTKPADQRATIRAQAPRTWSNRQPGRG